MTIDAHYPGDLTGNLAFELHQRAGKGVKLGAPFRPQHGLAGIEEHFGLEHEAVADDAYVGPVAENGAQAPEEIGAIARQFLYPLRQRQVEALAQIGDLALRISTLLFGAFERILDRAELASQRCDLLVEDLNLRHSTCGHTLLAGVCV